MKPTRTWILVADGACARVLINDGPGRGVQHVPDMDMQTSHASNSDEGSDRPGRTFESSTGLRHAKEPRSDQHRQHKANFAQELSQLLDRSLAQDSYDRLVIVASPVTLGDLRAALSPPVRERVIAELAKDLTHIANDKVAGYLTDVLAV